mgnify:CR=1 FL=1
MTVHVGKVSEKFHNVSSFSHYNIDISMQNDKKVNFHISLSFSRSLIYWYILGIPCVPNQCSYEKLGSDMSLSV